MNIEIIIVVAVFILAITYVVFSLRRSFKKKQDNSACGSCTSCSASTEDKKKCGGS